MYMALIDAPLRIVIRVQFSKIGFGYPNIYIEKKLNQEYINIDCSLPAAFAMSQKNFEDWWEDATPKTIHDACFEAGFNEEVVRQVINFYLEK